MLDVRWVLENVEAVRAKTQARGSAFPFDRLEGLAAERRAAVHEAESRRAEQKRRSDALKALQPGTDAFMQEREALKLLAQEVKGLEERRRVVEETLDALILELPNVVDDRTPLGASDQDNVELRRHGQVPTFAFSVRDHVDLGDGLGGLHMEEAGRVSGARFAFLSGVLAKLERALVSFMLDVHTQEHGYREMLPPYLVQAAALVGTGQLPKFEEDLFRAGDHFLIPTAEVPVTNFHREQLLGDFRTPYRYAAFSPCFRREAGSHGRDTRGLIRLHQFHKVELVIVCRPEESEEEHHALVGHATRILELLELPHRVIELCAGDIGFSASRCFDIEAWLPSQGRWVEVSSCSNFRDFQARRAQIRYRDDEGRARHVHTLNGSGLAVGRTMVVLLENHQREDGSIHIPEALRPYMGGRSLLLPE